MTTTYTNPPISSAHSTVRDQLLRRIGTHWKKGERLPSIRDISSEMGTAYVSTQRAAQELVLEGLLVSKPRVGLFVAKNFDAKRVARASARAKPATMSRHVARPLAGLRVALVRSKPSQDAFFVPIVDSFLDALRPHGCVVEVIDAPSGQVWDTELDVSGLALLQTNLTEISFLPHQALVIAETDANGLKPALTSNHDVVSVDQEHGGTMAGEFMKSRHIKSVCLVGRASGDDTPDGAMAGFDRVSSQRFVGFERGWGRSVPASCLLAVGSYDICDGAESVQRYLAMADRPQGVFTATDELALGFIYGARAHGLYPGKDFHIMGFDGLAAGRSLSRGPLTTIDAPIASMGRIAAELLASRLGDLSQVVRRVQLGCSVFEGNTVKDISSSLETGTDSHRS